MQLTRLLKILHVFIKFRLDELLPGHPLLRPFKWAILLVPTTWVASTREPVWARLRMALIELGPVFIKFGQLLSTRQDMLPEDAIKELQTLQDQVPPFDEQLAIAIIEQELKKPITDLFATFDQKPLASASVAQVHTATLKSGEEVVVKVLRPGIGKIVTQDTRLLLTLARWAEALMPDLQRFHPVQMVRDYDHIIHGELDLSKEAANTAQFRRNFRNSALLYVPEVYWNYTTSNVMTMERVYGVPVSNTDAIKNAGIDLKTLSEIGVEVFFTQVFRDNFFHADMHPGNVMVSLENPHQPQYLSLDNAIVGSLSRQERSLLARQLMALLDKDYEQMALLLIEAGWVPGHIREHEFANALRTVLEPVLERPLKDIEFGPTLIRLFQVARRFEMQALPQFLLLEKTLIHIEGMGRQLDPELDIWAIGRPLLEEWIKEQMGPGNILKSLKRNTPALLENLPQAPGVVWEALNELRNLSSNQQQLFSQMETRLVRGRREKRLLLIALTGLVAGGLWALGPQSIPQLTDLPWFAWAAGGGGLGVLLSRIG